eukprot:scaffold25443_cov75-Phaeocystis_antarctica.AAC.4
MRLLSRWLRVSPRGIVVLMKRPGPRPPAALPLPVERARARDAAWAATARRGACWDWRPISSRSARDARLSRLRREVGRIVTLDGESERHPVEAAGEGESVVIRSRRRDGVCWRDAVRSPQRPVTPSVKVSVGERGRAGGIEHKRGRAP